MQIPAEDNAPPGEKQAFFENLQEFSHVEKSQ
jgi:hypothetical protein